MNNERNENPSDDNKKELLRLKDYLEHEKNELKKFLADFYSVLSKEKNEGVSRDDKINKVKEIVKKYDAEKNK